MLALLAIAMVGLLVRALATFEFTGALFLVGMAVWFAWTIGGFIKRNRPRSYSFDAASRGAAAVSTVRNQAK